MKEDTGSCLCITEKGAGLEYRGIFPAEQLHNNRKSKRL